MVSLRPGRTFDGTPMEAVRYWLPRALGLLSFLWFALMAAPTFYWLDSAELSAGALGLGSPHPSGFPLYMMMAKAASLVPIGELAFRVNLLSAFCGAVAVGGVARLVLVLGREDWATVAGAVGAGGIVCFSYLFARQATVAEVYAPTAALIVLTLLLFERVASGGNARVGLSLAWVSGLGFAVHPEYRMLMGLPIVALLGLRVYRGARWPLLAPAMAIFGALGSYLYLPVRSATGRIATLDWGHPDTLARAWAHGTGAEVRKVFDDQMMSTTRELVSHDVSTFVGQILDYLGVLAVLAGLVGVVILLIERRTRWPGVAIATVLVLDFLYASWINPMGLIDLQNGVPTVLGVSICAGVAVAGLARSAGSAAPYLGSVVALLMTVPLAWSSFSVLSLVGDLPRDFTESPLLTAPVGALVLSQGDSLSAGTAFVQIVEGARPDVGSLVVPMLSDRERVAHVLASTKSEPIDAAEAGTDAVFSLWKQGRSVLWEPGPYPLPPGSVLQHGPVVGLLVAADKDTAPSAETLTALGRLYAGDTARDPAARRVVATSLTYLGRSALRNTKVTLAEQLFRSALDVRPGHAVALVNLGVIYSRAGDLERAAIVSEQALKTEPNRPQALVNAARYRLALGDLGIAAKHANRALAVAPKSAASWVIAGLVDMKAGRDDRARTRLQTALEIAPRHREAREALAALNGH